MDAAKQLLKTGVVRGLAVLLPKCCSSSTSPFAGINGPAGPAPRQEGIPAPAESVSSIPLPSSSYESLRLVLLMCAACSPAEVGEWLLAVPGCKAWLESDPEMRPGGAAEVHGAIWQLLTAQITALKAKAATAIKNGSNNSSRSIGIGEASSSSGGSEMLVRFLQSSDLTKLRSTLQLMTAVHQVADGRVKWDFEIQARMKTLAQELRDKAVHRSDQQIASFSSPGAAAAVCEPDVEGALSSDSGGGGRLGNSSEAPVEHQRRGERLEDPDEPLTAVHVPEEGEDALDGHVDDDDMKLHNQDPDELLKARRNKQLVPDCIRMLKSLIVSEGKTD